MGTELQIVEALDTLLVDVNDGALPTHTHYFDHVWVGKPNKIPMGDRCIAYIEMAQEPEFGYTTCPTNYIYDADVIITIMSKGTVEVATKHLYTVVAKTKTALMANDTLSGVAIGGTIEYVEYGDVIAQNADSKVIVAGARILVKYRMSG